MSRVWLQLMVLTAASARLVALAKHYSRNETKFSGVNWVQSVVAVLGYMQSIYVYIT